MYQALTSQQTVYQDTPLIVSTKPRFSELTSVALAKQKGVLDLQLLESYIHAIGDDWEDFFLRMIETYLIETPQSLYKLNAELQRANSIEIENLAHALKSNSAVVGAISVSKLCEEIEILSRQKKLYSIQSLLKQLNFHQQRAAYALSHVCNELGFAVPKCHSSQN